MADRVEEKSKGKLKVVIYPSQQLGTERELVELLQIGSLGMTKVSTGVVENFAPELKVVGLPFLFKFIRGQCAKSFERIDFLRCRK